MPSVCARSSAGASGSGIQRRKSWPRLRSRGGSDEKLLEESATSGPVGGCGSLIVGQCTAHSFIATAAGPVLRFPHRPARAAELDLRRTLAGSPPGGRRLVHRSWAARNALGAAAAVHPWPPWLADAAPGGLVWRPAGAGTAIPAWSTGRCPGRRGWRRFARRVQEPARRTSRSMPCCSIYYRDGNDSMGWHSDDEPELGRDPLIASLNLGWRPGVSTCAARAPRASGIRWNWAHGSLLVMGGQTQHHWQHQVAKTRKPVRATASTSPFVWSGAEP